MDIGGAVGERGGKSVVYYRHWAGVRHGVKLSTLEYPVADVLEWKRTVGCLYKIPKKERALARRNKSNGMYSGPSMLKPESSVKIFV